MVGRYVIAVMFSGTRGGLIQAAKKLEISLASQFANDIGKREFVSRKAVHRVSMDEPQHGHSIREHGGGASCSRARRKSAPFARGASEETAARIEVQLQPQCGSTREAKHYGLTACGR